MKTVILHSAIALLAMMVFIPTVHAQGEPQVRMMSMENPANTAASGVLTPAQLIHSQSYSGSFGGGDPPTTATGTAVFVFTADVEALVEDFRFEAGPHLNSAELGFYEVPGFPAMFDAYFALYPDMDYAWAWISCGDSNCCNCEPTDPKWCMDCCEFDDDEDGCDCSDCEPGCCPGPVAFSQSFESKPQLMGPMGRCAPATEYQFSMTMTGAPYVGSGVAGFKRVGTVTQNRVCAYVDTSTLTGHGWLELVPDGGPSTSHGLYPRWLAGLPWFKTVPGCINDDSVRPSWDRRICYLVPTAQYNQIANGVHATQASCDCDQWLPACGYKMATGPFGVADNCVSWVVRMLAAGGLEMPQATTLGISDPTAMTNALAGLGDELYNNCGRMETGPGGLVAHGDYPTNFSPAVGFFMSVEEPQALADMLGLQAILHDVQAATPLAPGGEVTIEFVGVDKGEFGSFIDWGNESYDIVFQESSAETAEIMTSGEIRVGVFEAGSIQRSVFPVEIDPEGPVNVTLVVDVVPHEEVLIDNGPFVPASEPVYVDQPVNTKCSNTIIVGPGVTEFTNIYANTTGPDEAGYCDLNGETNILSDVWFATVAQCTGELTVSLAGSDFPTTLALYPVSCPNQPGTVLACDAGSLGEQSEVTLFVEGPQGFRIRIGGVNGAQGNGVLTITCDPVDPPCLGDLNDDCIVDVSDLLILLSNWGACPPEGDCIGDLNEDGTVDVSDLLILLSNWG